MSVNLHALWRDSQLSRDPAENERIFTDTVRKGALRGDLLCYGLYVHGDQAPVLATLAYAEHARRIAALMEAHRQTLVVCPPEHGKTALNRWDTELWLGLRTRAAFADKKETVPSALYIMNTAGQAEKQIMEIEETLETNARYRELFPEVRPDKKRGWTKDHFFLDRPRSRPEPSLQGCGTPGPIQGARVGKITVDDPTDQEDALSEPTLRKQAAWLSGTLDDRVMRGGTKRFILTRWSEKDTYSVLSRDRKTKVLVMPALDEKTGAPLWAEEWPLDRLMEKKESLIDKGMAYLWDLTWLCNPKRAEGNIVKRAWLNYGPSPLIGQEAQVAV